MAFETHLDDHVFPGGVAATQILPRTAVKVAGTSALLFFPAASNNEEAIGVTGAATTAAGEIPVVYFDGNIVKMLAGAATAYNTGAAVSVGSVNGVVIPQAITASGHWELGKVVSYAAAASEVVSVFVKIKKA